MKKILLVIATLVTLTGCSKKIECIDKDTIETVKQLGQKLVPNFVNGSNFIDDLTVVMIQLNSRNPETEAITCEAELHFTRKSDADMQKLEMKDRIGLLAYSAKKSLAMEPSGTPNKAKIIYSVQKDLSNPGQFIVNAKVSQVEYDSSLPEFSTKKSSGTTTQPVSDVLQEQAKNTPANPGQPSKYPRCAGSVELEKCEADEEKLEKSSMNESKERSKKLEEDREKSMREVNAD